MSFFIIISVVYSHVIVFVFINNFSIRHWLKVTEMSCFTGRICDVLLVLNAPIYLCIPMPLLYIALPATAYICFLYSFIYSCSETVSLCSRGCFSLPGMGLQACPPPMPGFQGSSAAVCLFFKYIILCRSNGTDFVRDLCVYFYKTHQKLVGPVQVN